MLVGRLLSSGLVAAIADVGATQIGAKKIVAPSRLLSRVGFTAVSFQFE